MSADRVAAYDRFDAATVYEAVAGTSTLDPAIRPVWHGARLWGPAFTARCEPGDNLAIHHAVAAAPAGAVLVVDAGQDLFGSWGEILTVAAQARGIVGLVIDGGIRDALAIERLAFPVFSRGFSVRGTTKRSLGAVNSPIDCGGVRVAPGDLVVGDEDGVVVVPAAAVSSVADAAARRVAREAAYLERLRAGETTLVILDLPPMAAAT